MRSPRNGARGSSIEVDTLERARISTTGSAARARATFESTSSRLARRASISASIVASDLDASASHTESPSNASRP